MATSIPEFEQWRRIPEAMDLGLARVQSLLAPGKTNRNFVLACSCDDGLHLRAWVNGFRQIVPLDSNCRRSANSLFAGLRSLNKVV
jgi:hypothetical protein